MLPNRCIQLPCRNIDVKIVGIANVGRDEAVDLDERVERGRRVRHSENSCRNTRPLIAIRPIVATGTVCDGMTSRSGNMPEYNPRAMICRNCGTEIADKALICYRCGTATTEPRVRRRQRSTPGRPPRVAWCRCCLALRGARRRRACSWDGWRRAGRAVRKLGYAARGGRGTLATRAGTLWPRRRQVVADAAVAAVRSDQLSSEVGRTLNYLPGPLPRYARRSPRGHRRPRPARHPHRQAGVLDRPPQRQRPAAGRQRRLARSRRNRARQRPVPAARPRLPLRHVRQRRSRHRARS